MNKLLYRSIEEALHELNAQDKGRYYICTCPECEKDEAYLYKNNMKMIQCNRENQCGERFILKFVEKEDFNKVEIENEKIYPKLTSEQEKDLHELTWFLKYMQKYPMSPTLDMGYRGLSRDSIRPFVADLKDGETVRKMFKNARSLFMKNYDKNKWICKRNLVFPIYGEDGLVERVLLRSSSEPDMEPKEIQLSVNPSKETRDFFVDIPKHANAIVIAEAILDGASFREIDTTVGILALTGAAKTRQITEYIKKNKRIFQNKQIILAMDNDEAGENAKNVIIKSLDEIEVKYKVFDFPKNIKDANEYLVQDKESFKKTWLKTIEKEKIRRKVLER